jgi:hypothetical protein
VVVEEEERREGKEKRREGKEGGKEEDRGGLQLPLDSLYKAFKCRESPYKIRTPRDCSLKTDHFKTVPLQSNQYSNDNSCCLATGRKD